MRLSDKNILITGADGFIGSHLTESLFGKCAHIKALTYYNAFNNWGNLENTSFVKNIEVVSGDVRDPFFCESLTKGVDVIFNLAALIAIPYSYIAPQSYIETNINGALNICQGALKNGARMIQVSTSEVYGTAEYVPIDEKHSLKPQSPYSASKIGADSIALSFCSSFGLPVTIARPFNTYGPRQSARAFIPTIITQILSGVKKIKLGNLTPTRDLNYVLDTCEGLIKIAEADNVVGEVVNIGSNTEISVGEVFEKIRSIMDADVETIEDVQRLRPESSEVLRLRCDNSKIRRLTGYEPKYGIDEGLNKTISWFSDKARLSIYKADIYNL